MCHYYCASSTQVQAQGCPVELRSVAELLISSRRVVIRAALTGSVDKVFGVLLSITQ